MSLNYAKWERIELSDDSDIECHPAIDKKSYIRFLQREIRKKREARNHRIAELEAGVACHEVLLTRLRTFQSELVQSGKSRFSSEMERLRANPSPDAPDVPKKTDAPKPISYDEMILRLLETIANEARETAGSDEEKLLEERLESHIKTLSDATEEKRKEKDVLLEEKAEHITMDDLHVVFDSKYVPTKPDLPIIGKGRKEGLPHMTPNLEEFAKLPLWDFNKSWRFIQNHLDIVVPDASDALLVSAFRAQRAGKSKYARQCVHQGLILQYAERLGKHGVQRMFRSLAGGQTLQAFRKDVEATYQEIVSFVNEAAAEGVKIQLEAKDPDTVISFNVPDGPPGENSILEGRNRREYFEPILYEDPLLSVIPNIEKTRASQQKRWDLFCKLPENLQKALKTNELTAVNEVLGDMPVSEAENVAKALEMSGIIRW